MGRAPNNVVRVPCSSEQSFFKYWFKFLYPFHHLTNKEIDVIAGFVRHRYELSKVINDVDILDKVTMSDDTKEKIKEECNMTSAHLQVIMSNLKKSGVIKDGKINSKFIPNINKNDSGTFLLTLLFEIK